MGRTKVSMGNARPISHLLTSSKSLSKNNIHMSIQASISHPKESHFISAAVTILPLSFNHFPAQIQHEKIYIYIYIYIYPKRGGNIGCTYKTCCYMQKKKKKTTTTTSNGLGHQRLHICIAHVSVQFLRVAASTVIAALYTPYSFAICTHCLPFWTLYPSLVLSPKLKNFTWYFLCAFSLGLWTGLSALYQDTNEDKNINKLPAFFYTILERPCHIHNSCFFLLISLCLSSVGKIYMIWIDVCVCVENLLDTKSTWWVVLLLLISTKFLTGRVRIQSQELRFMISVIYSPVTLTHQITFQESLILWFLESFHIWWLLVQAGLQKWFQGFLELTLQTSRAGYSHRMISHLHNLRCISDQPGRIFFFFFFFFYHHSFGKNTILSHLILIMDFRSPFKKRPEWGLDFDHGSCRCQGAFWMGRRIYKPWW
ncbi:hypothetical protein VP01_639g2 [Puccinia sorghi]|uniref:Uncharacterized protein n=1 Tax=Puccinia sorghi TaxID=27349 RepID=A0A0L6UFV9_9BASI|nr:hypothetical protein VP01_639g2 [Puccinia sorghi]